MTEQNNKEEEVFCNKQRCLITLFIFLITAAVSILLIFLLATSQTKNIYPSFTGGNHYYIYTCNEEYQHQIFKTMNKYNMKVLRLFILSTKGHGFPNELNCFQYEDIENPVGTFNNDLLNKLDKTLSIGKTYDIKFIISMHDRWSLGCWRSDAYNEKYKFYTGPIPYTDCNSMTSYNNPTLFYNDKDVKNDFINRLSYILDHRNLYLDNKTYGELNDVIFAFEPQNEPQRGKTIPLNENWLCDMSNHIKTKTNIMVGSGGGWESIPFPGISLLGGDPIEKMYNCKTIDLITLHDYQNIVPATISFEYHVYKSKKYNKLLMLSEFGFADHQALKDHIELSNTEGMPWLIFSIDCNSKELSFFSINNTYMINTIGPKSLATSKILTWQKFP